MMQTTLSSNRYDGIRMESLRKRQDTHNSLNKIRPIDDEKNRSKISKPNMSYKPIWMTPSETINSTVRNGDNTFPITVTSIQHNKTIPQQEVSFSNMTTNRSKIFTSTENGSATPKDNNNNNDKQMKWADQSQKYNRLCKPILMVFYGVLGILFLTALILPSILVYILAPKSSQTELPELTRYANHCAGISPRSLWEMDTETTITMKINTSECNFQDTPLYFVSIAGVCSHFCLTGYGAIYLPTTESFQIYTRYTCGSWNATELLDNAQLCGWDVNWMGFYY